MLLAHFTTQRHAEDIVNNGINKPIHLTSDFVLGCNYGSYCVLFKVPDDFLCAVGRVGTGDKCNHRTNGMIEYVLRTQSEIVSFMGAVENYGVRHVVHLRHLMK